MGCLQLKNGKFVLWKYYEIFHSLPISEQVSGAHANEIKHGHSPEVIVGLDPRYD